MAAAILRGCGLAFFAASQFEDFAPLAGCDGRIRPECGVQNLNCMRLHTRTFAFFRRRGEQGGLV